MENINKLVRDNIPSIIENKGGTCQFRKLKYEEYLEELDKKLSEEVREYRASKNIEELADIVEVIYAICKSSGISVSELERVRKDKAELNGKFKDRIYLMSAED